MAGITDKIVMLVSGVFAVVFVLVIVSLPTVTAAFLYRWLKKKRVKYVGIILLTIAPAWTVYTVYTAFYPNDSFYFSEFKKVTLRTIPKSAVIIKKDASYPDFHGDYCSASLIVLSIKDYNSLLTTLSGDNRFSSVGVDEIWGSEEWDKVMGNLADNKIFKGFTREIPGKGGHYLYIGFLNDKRTVVVHVCVT